MEQLYKLLKHHITHLKDLHQRKENPTEQNQNSSMTFGNGQPVMIKNHAYHTFEPKYLLDYNVLKILNDSTLLFITPNGKERKNINDV